MYLKVKCYAWFIQVMTLKPSSIKNIKKSFEKGVVEKILIHEVSSNEILPCDK